MFVPMPSPKGTNRARLFIDASRFPSPRMAMDAVPSPQIDTGEKPMIDDNAFKQIVETLKGRLDEKTFMKVYDALVVYTKMSMDDEPNVAPRKADPEAAERAMDFLRSKGIDEDKIDWIRKAHFGVEKPTQAMDSSRRARAADEYAKQFPAAARIATDAIEYVRAVPASPSALKSFNEMFPQARRFD